MCFNLLVLGSVFENIFPIYFELLLVYGAKDWISLPVSFNFNQLNYLKRHEHIDWIL